MTHPIGRPKGAKDKAPRARPLAALRAEIEGQARELMRAEIERRATQIREEITRELAPPTPPPAPQPEPTPAPPEAPPPAPEPEPEPATTRATPTADDGLIRHDQADLLPEAAPAPPEILQAPAPGSTPSPDPGPMPLSQDEAAALKRALDGTAQAEPPETDPGAAAEAAATALERRARGRRAARTIFRWGFRAESLAIGMGYRLTLPECMQLPPAPPRLIDAMDEAIGEPLGRKLEPVARWIELGTVGELLVEHASITMRAVAQIQRARGKKPAEPPGAEPQPTPAPELPAPAATPAADETPEGPP